MKVRVTFTVDVDPELWELNYGETDKTVIREQTVEMCREAAWEQLSTSGVLS